MAIGKEWTAIKTCFAILENYYHCYIQKVIRGCFLHSLVCGWPRHPFFFYPPIRGAGQSFKPLARSSTGKDLSSSPRTHNRPHHNKQYGNRSD